MFSIETSATTDATETIVQVRLPSRCDMSTQVDDSSFAPVVVRRLTCETGVQVNPVLPATASAAVQIDRSWFTDDTAVQASVAPDNDDSGCCPHCRQRLSTATPPWLPVTVPTSGPFPSPTNAIVPPATSVAVAPAAALNMTFSPLPDAGIGSDLNLSALFRHTSFNTSLNMAATVGGLSTLFPPNHPSVPDTPGLFCPTDTPSSFPDFSLVGRSSSASSSVTRNLAIDPRGFGNSASSAAGSSSGLLVEPVVYGTPLPPVPSSVSSGLSSLAVESQGYIPAPLSGISTSGPVPINNTLECVVRSLNLLGAAISAPSIQPSVPVTTASTVSCSDDLQRLLTPRCLAADLFAPVVTVTSILGHHSSSVVDSKTESMNMTVSLPFVPVSSSTMNGSLPGLTTNRLTPTCLLCQPPGQPSHL